MPSCVDNSHADAVELSDCDCNRHLDRHANEHGHSDVESRPEFDTEPYRDDYLNHGTNRYAHSPGNGNRYAKNRPYTVSLSDTHPRAESRR